jgi:hypothetical protein
MSIEKETFDPKPQKAEILPQDDLTPAKEPNIDDKTHQTLEQGVGEDGAAPTPQGSQASEAQNSNNDSQTSQPRTQNEIASNLLGKENLNPKHRQWLEEKYGKPKTQEEVSPKPEPSEIGEHQAKLELKGDYGQSLSNPEENTSLTKSELSGGPAPGADPFVNLRKKYGSEPSSDEASPPVEPQESVDRSRP